MGENGIQYRGEGIDVDKEFQICLTNKFSLFKGIIMKHIHLKNPAMKLNKQEAARLIEYARESYFKHLRLYEFVFNNKAPNEVKRINFIEEQARNEMPLSQALQISAGRPQTHQSNLESAMAVHSNMELGMELEQYTRGVSMNDVDEEMEDMDYDQQMDEPMDMDSQMDQD